MLASTSSSSCRGASPQSCRVQCRIALPRSGLARTQRACSWVACAAPVRQLELHVGETTLSLPLDFERAKLLDAAMTQLLQTFAAKQKAERPKRLDLLEVRFKGDPEKQDELEFFEVVCNPNAYTTAFEAKMLVTLRTKGGVKVVTEARLSAIKADIDVYMTAAASAGGQ